MKKKLFFFSASDVLKNSTLFIGISTNHPGLGVGETKQDSRKTSPPSVVGVN